MMGTRKCKPLLQYLCCVEMLFFSIKVMFGDFGLKQILLLEVRDQSTGGAGGDTSSCG